MSRQSQSQSSLNTICPSWPQPLLTHLAPRLFITSVALPWVLSNGFKSFPYCDPNCTQGWRWGCAAQRREDNPFPHSLAVLGLVPPRVLLTVLAPGYIAGSNSTYIRQNPQTPFHRDALQPLVPQSEHRGRAAPSVKIELLDTQPLHKPLFTAQS